MVSISYTHTLPSKSHLVVLKPQDGDFVPAYASLQDLCDTVEFSKTAVFPKVCDAECVYALNMGGDTHQGVGGRIYDLVKHAHTVYVDVRGMSIHHAVGVAMGIRLKSYTFDMYKTITKKTSALEKVVLVGDDVAGMEAEDVRASAIAHGIFTARDVANAPANILTPETYANRVKELENLGVKVHVLEPRECQSLGMGALLGVAQGSANPARVVVMEYNGGHDSDAPFAFVGKGVTFDTGGISLKPAGGMEDMKFDMGGSAAVFGAMRTLALRQAKANVVGIIGLVENMPDGNAQRPGDIVTSMSGQTIEVLNTDAEGRLVLADCLTYVQEKYAPRCIVDLATLTGAIMIALGTQYAGVFGNSEDFTKTVVQAAKNAGEKAWYMPLDKDFDAELDSPVADMKNISSGRWGGSCTAAAFLGRFIQNDTPWVHIDIAGTASSNKGNPTAPTGATGYGVATLDQLIFEYENTI